MERTKWCLCMWRWKTGERLKRAIRREEQQKVPKYEEMCRRFLADAEDFSEENCGRQTSGKGFSIQSWRIV